MKQRNKAPDVIKDTVDSGDKLEKPAQVDTGVRYRYRDTGVRYRYRIQESVIDRGYRSQV